MSHIKRWSCLSFLDVHFGDLSRQVTHCPQEVKAGQPCTPEGFHEHAGRDGLQFPRPEKGLCPVRRTRQTYRLTPTRPNETPCA